LARYTCKRCKADCNTLDDPHLCKDLKKRYERNAKAVTLVMDVLKEYRVDIAMPLNGGASTAEDLATAIVKALSGRDLGVD
jgi:transposase-like protein